MLAGQRPHRHSNETRDRRSAALLAQGALPSPLLFVFIRLRRLAQGHFGGILFVAFAQNGEARRARGPARVGRGNPASAAQHRRSRIKPLLPVVRVSL
jgi:hypothetical protein